MDAQRLPHPRWSMTRAILITKTSDFTTLSETVAGIRPVENFLTAGIRRRRFRRFIPC